MLKKRKMSFYLSIYLKILSQDLKSKLSYRTDFWVSILGMLVTNIAGFLSIMILFQNIETIGEWNYHQLLFLYGFSLIATTPVQCFFDNNWNLGGYVLSGEFIKYCLRPINIFFYYISEVFDIKGIGQLIFGIITICYSWKALMLPISITSIILLVFELLSASLFMIAMMNIAAATSFWIINSGDIMILTFRFREYARYPINIFSPICKIIFTYIIPIAFISYYPSLFFIKEESVSFISWMTPIFGLLFFGLSIKLWLKGAKSYSGTGS